MPCTVSYSNNDAPETWTTETAWFQLSISDTIVNRNRIAEIYISNPRDTKKSIYTAYRRVKIVESNTNSTVFLGRVIVTDPAFDDQYGQILKVTLSDYISPLFDRKVDKDYSATAYKRSELIQQIIWDYASGQITSSNITESGSSETLTKDFTGCNMPPIKIIEGFAQEDPWDDTPTGYGYDYYVDDNQKFHYFKRGSKAAALTIKPGVAEDANTRCMLHDYVMSDVPKEIITRVTVYGVVDEGERISYTATDSALESTLGTVKEYTDFVWGNDLNSSNTFTYCQTRANALLASKGGTITRGKFGFYRYPYSGVAKDLVRVGDLVHIEIASQSIDGDYLVLGVNYQEPTALTRMEVVSYDKGRGLSPYDLDSVLAGLSGGDDVYFSSARIGDLYAWNASITNLKAGNLHVTGKIISMGRFIAIGDSGAYIVIGDVDAGVYVSGQMAIAGFDNTSTTQFYLTAQDGKAYFAQGRVKCDYNGMSIDGASGMGWTSGTLFTFTNDGEWRAVWYANEKEYQVYLSSGTTFYMGCDIAGSLPVCDARFTPNIKPYVNNQIDVGSSSLQFKASYIKKSYHDTRLKIPVGTNMYD